MTHIKAMAQDRRQEQSLTQQQKQRWLSRCRKNVMGNVEKSMVSVQKTVISKVSEELEIVKGNLI